MQLRPAKEAEQARIRALLTDSGLPIDDLDCASVEFIVAADDAGPVGVVGVQPFDGIGLLRSLAVSGQARGSGMGSALVDALEAHARASGINQLVLLTQTAESFFAKRGYAVISREAAPVPVRQSAEFRSICPSSATCMTKHLDSMP